MTLRGIEGTHRIEEPQKTRGKTRPIIVKFVRYNDRNRVLFIESLTKTSMDKLKQAKETYGFTNFWTNDGKILFKSDSNAKPQVYCS